MDYVHSSQLTPFLDSVKQGNIRKTTSVKKNSELMEAGGENKNIQNRSQVGNHSRIGLWDRCGYKYYLLRNVPGTVATVNG